ncbi:hypothetical protein RF11_02077 [Thelohanellus kitauei]|uniref:Uncharacterized protein n=1 Tax=Thelohanellus kitauei TaxID=669202 RepID=A0A0C2JB64_THEKT|nr:hypothetical protein RF11_02077 [Thelohanellus kitauei]
MGADKNTTTTCSDAKDAEKLVCGTIGGGVGLWAGNLLGQIVKGGPDGWTGIKREVLGSDPYGMAVNMLYGAVEGGAAGVAGGLFGGVLGGLAVGLSTKIILGAFKGKEAGLPGILQEGNKKNGTTINDGNLQGQDMRYKTARLAGNLVGLAFSDTSELATSFIGGAVINSAAGLAGSLFGVPLAGGAAEATLAEIRDKECGQIPLHRRDKYRFLTHKKDQSCILYKNKSSLGGDDPWLWI